MKKLVLFCTAFLFVASLFSSCSNDPNKEYCFELRYFVEERGSGHGGTYYYWCTEEQMRAELVRMKEELIESGVPEEYITVSGKRAYNKSESACTKLQPSDESEQEDL